VDLELVRPELRASLIARFKIKLHSEMRQGTGWQLTVAKPKLAKTDPADRTRCQEGPGKDGKDPRTSNPSASRLINCQNVTMAEFLEQLPVLARGYFRTTEQIIDATGLTGAYDF